MSDSAMKRTAKQARDSPTAMARRQRKFDKDLRRATERGLANQVTFPAKLFKALADGKLTPERFPCGRANCLAGMRFHFIGFEHRLLDHDQLIGLMKQYGGKSQAVASAGTSWVVMRGSPGSPSQLAKVVELGVPLTNEAGLFELIRRLPGKGPAGVVSDAVAKSATTQPPSTVSPGHSAVAPPAEPPGSTVLTSQALASTASSLSNDTTAPAPRRMLSHSRNGSNVRSPTRSIVVKAEERDGQENVVPPSMSNDDEPMISSSAAQWQPAVTARHHALALSGAKPVIRPVVPGLTWLTPLTRMIGV
ncbi:hypothetical protein B0A48_11521 [Cryoendolithus antarcticus]|uniref:BRCT domain-containing protein n=1 Tax=Cryoendolithus antarcticus TaxID=1507870 RepID=A0A1V8SVQ9_9PEZI|nr:hypothetical protein B0A48_11521 [Cryoendolithus antarcticus]